MPLFFSKYQGAGNDFILIDDRSASFPWKRKDLISFLCHRKFGIGADGLILLHNSSSADFTMRYFNADGSEPGMCGNCLRCLAAFIHSLGLAEKSCFIETGKGKHAVHFLEGKIAVSMGRPDIIHWGIPLPFGDKTLKGYVLHTGVPHAVFFLDEIEDVDLDRCGRQVRFSPFFSPEGVNVNIASLKRDGTLRIRTYERGVEGETLACGTGAVAAAYAASEIFGTNFPLRILPSSSEYLEVVRENKESEIFLLGPAALVFQGEALIPKEGGVHDHWHSKRGEES